MLEMYRSAHVLDRHQHRGLRIAPPAGFAHARACVALPLTLPEYVQAAHEYPIVFTEAGEGPRSVVLLGIRPAENLFVAADGRWEGRYVPAIVRRYPFVLAERGDGAEPLVCVDAAHAGYGASDGEALFTDEGEPSRYLGDVMSFLRAFRVEVARTRSVVEQFAQLGLLQAMKANFEPVGSDPCVLDGFRVIDGERLAGLAGAELEALARSGALAAAYAHLFSLACFTQLLSRAARPAQAA